MRWMMRIAWVAEPQARDDDLVGVRFGTQPVAATTLHRPRTLARMLMEVRVLLKVVPKVIL